MHVEVRASELKVEVVSDNALLSHFYCCIDSVGSKWGARLWEQMRGGNSMYNGGCIVRVSLVASCILAWEYGLAKATQYHWSEYGSDAFV